MHLLTTRAKILAVRMFVAAVFIVPSAASAMTLVKFFGFLNILVGLFLTLALILYGAALIVYFTRFGCPNRMEALDLVEWAIAILFILIVLLGIVQYFQSHPTNMVYVIGVILFILIVWLIIYAYSGGVKSPSGSPGPPGR